MTIKEILVAFTAGDSPALGNIWRITAKKSDFYLDPHATVEAFHLSAHGPNGDHPDGHRFHVRVDRKAAAAIQAQGDFISHKIPRKGRALNGEELAPGVFRIARIRWLWDLQRPRFRQAARLPGPLPDVSSNRSAARLSRILAPNRAADLDLIVSYNEPYWPDERNSLRDKARLGPLRNESGMWLTATSYQRSQTAHPTPEGLALPLPKPGEDPNRIMGGAPEDGAAGDMYWFVEGVTSRQFIEASRSEQEG
ncbi:hypothetical protein [Micromonospora sp. WMMD998]|uniref:hypothetical protein n=1 Tax=Micromonospora sp. WMMD998 TaxID=3016092 RepID=UPI00249BAE3B|nr:hypothetical protein [Micromonospora sp. WMMD998]WFE37690.1 hypothetical protein O7619_04270 [Micromonospora sp. WMMD998]